MLPAPCSFPSPSKYMFLHFFLRFPQERWTFHFHGSWTSGSVDAKTSPTAVLPLQCEWPPDRGQYRRSICTPVLRYLQPLPWTLVWPRLRTSNIVPSALREGVEQAKTSAGRAALYMATEEHQKTNSALLRKRGELSASSDTEKDISELKQTYQEREVRMKRTISLEKFSYKSFINRLLRRTHQQLPAATCPPATANSKAAVMPPSATAHRVVTTAFKPVQRSPRFRPTAWIPL